MRTVIVPNYISDAIYAKVDAAIAMQPAAAPDRDYFYGILLNYFDAHCGIPDFALKARAERDAAKQEEPK